ncbi:MAG: aspartyl/asparaginyl beta-hydroxylase domain-containing protein [Pleurocapsa sp.]
MPTAALEFCPYIKELLDELPAEKKRVRFLSLEANKEIRWHCDGTGSIDRIVKSSSSRFHIPVITSPKVEFKISHNTCQWEAGNMYYGDFSFPHRVKNNWDKRRIHLVVDLIPNDNLRALFPSSFLRNEYKRFILRKLCKKVYGRYWLKFQKDNAQKLMSEKQ